MVSSYLRVLCLVALLAVNAMAGLKSEEEAARLAALKDGERANASGAVGDTPVSIPGGAPKSGIVEIPPLNENNVGALESGLDKLGLGGDGDDEDSDGLGYDLTPEHKMQTLATSNELSQDDLDTHAAAQKSEDEIGAMSSMLAHDDIAASPPPPHKHAAAVVAKMAQHRATGHAALKKAVEKKGKTTAHATNLHDDRVAVYGHGGEGMTFNHVFHAMTEAQIKEAVGKDPIKSEKEHFIELGKKKLELRTHMHTLSKGTITEENLAVMSEANINKHEHELSQAILKHTKAGTQALTDKEKKVAMRAQGHKTKVKKAKKGAPEPPKDAKKAGTPTGKTGDPPSPTSPHHGGPK